VVGEIDEERVGTLLADYCKSYLTSAPGSARVERQLIEALGKKPAAPYLDLLLQLARTVPSRQRGQIASKAAVILPYVDEQFWLGAIPRANTIYRNTLLHGLRKAGVKISDAASGEFAVMASREIDAIEWEKQSLETLSASGAGRMSLLACAIREELISIRLDTLCNLIALLDRTGTVATVLPRIRHSDAHVRARALEALENTGDAKINRAIISTIEWLDTLPPPKADANAPIRKKELMAAGSYCSSHNEWIATCAEYACAQPENA
jgi:hypothetical protein